MAAKGFMLSDIQPPGIIIRLERTVKKPDWIYLHNDGLEDPNSEPAYITCNQGYGKYFLTLENNTTIEGTIIKPAETLIFIPKPAETLIFIPLAISSQEIKTPPS